jgi:hypothetical protein
MIVLPVVICGCETWSPTFGEEHMLRTFENRVLRRILGPNSHKIIDAWRKHRTASWFVLLTINFRCYQIQTNEMGGAYGIYWGGGQEVFTLGFGGKT